MKKTKVVIVGFGAFGQALADVLEGNKDCTVCGVDIRDTGDPRQVKAPWGILRTTSVVFLVVPSTEFSEGLEYLKDLRHDVVLVTCSKGFDGITGKLPHMVLKERFPKNPVAVLSGPSLAGELRQDLPTNVTIASCSSAAANFLCTLFSPTIVFPQVSLDETGVSIFGVLKNVYALALGASDGLGLGSNVKASLALQAVCEMKGIVNKNGGNEETLLRHAGFGDFLTTAYGPSRNHMFGFKIARKESVEGILSEGFQNLPAVLAFVGDLSNVPLLTGIKAVFVEGVDPRKVLLGVVQKG